VVGFYGAPRITDDSTGELVVDPIKSVNEQASALAATKSRHDLNWYVTKLCKNGHAQLVAARKNCDIGPFPHHPQDPNIICHLFFWGYCRGQPVEMDLRFEHQDQKPLQPRPYSTPPTKVKQSFAIYGSPIIGKALFETNDSQLDQYRKPSMSLTQNDLFFG
jgi:hypothetical protein